MNADWPEVVNGWEFVWHGHAEHYRKRLANKVTISATWDTDLGAGTVEAHVDSAGLGRTLTRKSFHHKESFWTAAHGVLEVAANLPSLGAGNESPADSALFDTVAGTVHAEPGSSATPEAELTFTLLSGRTATLVLSEDQALDLASRIHALDKHVWSEQHHDHEPHTTTDVEVPDVSHIDSPPDTGHDVVTLLATRFDITEEHLMAHVDWSALIVVGEPAVSTLLNRHTELETALHPHWNPVPMDRPGEQWVVLRRTALN